MPRLKATPVKKPTEAAATDGASQGGSSEPPSQAQAPPPACKPEPFRRLRVRSSAGVRAIEGLHSHSTLQDLREAVNAAIGGHVGSLSFRGDDMTVMALLQDGVYPAGGSLFIGPESVLSLIGVTEGTVFNASVATKPPPEKPAKGKKAAGGRKRKAEAGSSGGGGGGGGKSKRAELGTLASTVLDGGASSSASPDDIAANFVLASGGDSLLGSSLAASMHVSQEGAKREEAAHKGDVEIIPVGKGDKHIDVAFGKQSERVRVLSAEDCIEVVKCILLRQSGSKRRQQAMLQDGASGPSLRLLKPEIIATRSPVLYWSLFDHSRSDRSMEGDVEFAVFHITQVALDRLKREFSNDGGE